jgi:DNA-binding response OmpR family regulator
MNRILIVDSDQVGQRMLRDLLYDHFEVHLASPDQCIEVASKVNPEICVIGEKIEIPKASLSFQLRSHADFRNVGILVLADNTSYLTEKLAHEAGADGLLAKPIHFDNFYYKILSIARRITGFTEFGTATFMIGELALHPETHEVQIGQQRFLTTALQMQILLAFSQNPNRLLTRVWMKDHIWKGMEISSRSIDAQISKLKRLVPALEEHLRSIYGEGYIFDTRKPERKVS